MHTFSALNQFLSVNVGFLQHRDTSNPASLPRVQFPPRGREGVRSQSISLEAVEQPQPLLNAEAAACAPEGTRGLGGCRDASDRGCWAAVGVEGRAEAPWPPSTAPSFACHSPVAFGPGGSGDRALPSQRCLDWKKGERSVAMQRQLRRSSGLSCPGGGPQNREGG